MSEAVWSVAETPLTMCSYSKPLGMCEIIIAAKT